MAQVCRTCWLFIIAIYFSIGASNVVANGDPSYPELIKLNEADCIVLNDAEMRQLPQNWRKYQGFVKKCYLKKSSASKPGMAVISIWAHDYLDAQGSVQWENFPLSMVVNSQFAPLGFLPEIYPMDSPTHLILYYGKWKGDLPTEIWIDVSNPAVSGDYYYEPLIWNEKAGQYEMRDKESKSGKRPVRIKQKK